MEKAIILLSGGLDSCVTLWWAKKKGYQCHALVFDYGQRHKKELIVSRKLAKKAKVPITTIRFRLPWSQSSLTDKKKALPRRSLKKIPNKIPTTYVPGRNTLFLSYGLSYADAIGAGRLVIGANAVDYSGYPDCRPKFIESFEKVAQIGSRQWAEKIRKIKVEAPLIHLTKAGIVRLGRKLKAPVEQTWSCYKGGKNPCGLCDSCILRNKGFQEAG